MEFESDMERRCAYIESLCLILEQSNFAIGRWTARLLRIVEDYLKTSITQVEACKVRIQLGLLVYTYIFKVNLNLIFSNLFKNPDKKTFFRNCVLKSNIEFLQILVVIYKLLVL